jgi:hypothetical protein
MDYQAILFDPIYMIQGVPARITLDSDYVSEFPSESESEDGVFDLTVIDKTAGVDLSFGGDAGNVATLVPAASVRVKELTAHGLTAEMLVQGAIEFNGATWTIKSTKPRPSLKGEGDGELYLILTGRS